VDLPRLPHQAAVLQGLAEPRQHRVVDRFGRDALAGAEAHQTAEADREGFDLEPVGELPPGRVERGHGARGQEVATGELEHLAEQAADVGPAARAQAVGGRHHPGQHRAEGAGVGGDGRRRQVEHAGHGAHGRAQVGEVLARGVLGVGEGRQHVGQGGQGRVEEGVALGCS